jgi:DNA-binding MarR family transcriptional regulator
MLKEGYLKRAPDPADGRQAKLSITQAGNKMHAKLVRYLVNRQEVILTALDTKERKQLRGIMQKLAKHSATLR